MEKENIFDYLFKDKADNEQVIENYFKLIEIEEKFKKEGLENEALEVTSGYIYNVEYEVERSYNVEKVKNGKGKYKREKEKIDFLKEIKDRTEKLKNIKINKQIIVDKIYGKKHGNPSLENLGLDKKQSEMNKINKYNEEVNDGLKKLLEEYKSAKNKKTKIKKKKNIKEYCYKNGIIIK